MADYNRNQQSSNRGSNQDWNENRGRMGRDDDDRNSGSNEDRGMRSSNYESSGWQSRYERDDSNRTGGYSTGRYGRHYDSDLQSGNFGSDRGYGYASYYGSDSNTGYGGMGSSSYGGGMGSGNQGNRGLYDRDYQGMGRGDYSNSGTRLGGSNYGSYGDGNRGYYEGRNQGGGSYGSNYGNRNAGGREDRNWFDRASDEVSSWFGDDEAERRRDRDKRMQGQHKGKGPKNYSRSDDRIKEDINDRLSDDPFIDASDIDVTVTNGEVTLSGTVDERSSKRRAEDIAENVSGVKNVENRIRVGSTSNTYGSSTSGTPGSNTESSSSSQSTSGVAGSERTRSKSYVTG
jgi:osmotically-inducible protein OsmY